MPPFIIRNILTEDENVGYSSEYRDIDNAFLEVYECICVVVSVIVVAD